MTKQRIFLILLIALLWAPGAHAQLIRGYDTFHHGTSISSAITLREDTPLRTFYFQKIIGFHATQYKLSAYDKNYHSLFSENSTLRLILDQTMVYLLVPEETSSSFRFLPFHDTEVSSIDITLTPEIIAKLEGATAVELAFTFADEPAFHYILPQKKLNEWKKVMAAEN